MMKEYRLKSSHHFEEKDTVKKSWTLDEALQFNIWYNELLKRQEKRKKVR